MSDKMRAVQVIGLSLLESAE